MMKILTVLSEVYPKFEVNELKSNVFFELLEDIDYITIKAAAKKHMLISEFPPTIADLRKIATEITNPKSQLTAADGWGEVTRLISMYGSCKFDPPERLQKVMESMSEATRMVVKYVGWQNICETENIEVIRGQFMKMYGLVEVREKKKILIPQNLRENIKELGEVGKIKLIEQPNRKRANI